MSPAHREPRQPRRRSRRTFSIFRRARSLRVAASALIHWSQMAAGGYALAYIGAKRPSPDDVDEILDGGSVGDGEGDGEGFMREFSKFVKGFQAM